MSDFEISGSAASAKALEHPTSPWANNAKRNFDEVAKEKLDNLADDDPSKSEPTMQTKKLHIGSGDIIGKSVIQDFFTCAGSLPLMGGSIVTRTICFADAISMLIAQLERQFVHMHPFIQWLFLEFSNIQEAPTKRLATIFLAQEFVNIIQVSRVIFAHYRVNGECPPIEGILCELEGIRKLRSTDYVAYDENLREKVPPNVLVN